jgi:hypothetical protein
MQIKAKINERNQKSSKKDPKVTPPLQQIPPAFTFNNGSHTKSSHLLERNRGHTQQTNSTNNNNSLSYSDVLQNNGNINDQMNSPNLFTATECMQIMTELIINLRNCKSKSDQLLVIANLATKYLHDGR